MPFRSNNFRRKKRTYKKKNTQLTRYRKPTTYDYARAAYSASMKLKRFVNPEVKVHYFDKLSETYGTTWSIANLSAIPQGGGQDNRDGIMVKPMNLTCHLWLKKGVADNDATQFRIIILRGKHENASTADLLQAYQGGSVAITDFMGFKLNSTKFNSKTLHDRVYKVEATNSLTGLTSRFVRFNIKLTGKIQYTGVATTIPEDGGLYMLYVSSNSFGSFDFQSKLTYTDN